jgi:vacuolar protein sorting-associated protein 54
VIQHSAPVDPLPVSQTNAVREEETPDSPISPSESISSVRTTRPSHPLTSLETVPAIFFEPEFNLTNPTTFSIVTEQTRESHDVEHMRGHDPASISYSVPLLEKLSHYADTVESHLVREIQARSSSFFSALSNLHDLQSESERCLRRISDLKGMLQQIDQGGAQKGLELVRQDAKVSQVRKVQDGVKLIKDVQEMRTIAEGLSAGGAWSDALNVVENVRILLDHKATYTDIGIPREDSNARRLSTVGEEDETNGATTPSSLFPIALQDVSLPSLHVFTALPRDLQVLMSQIASTLSEEFCIVAQHDLHLRTTDNNMEKMVAQEEDQALKERLSPLIAGLLRTGDDGLKRSLERWRGIVMDEIRAAVKRV